MAIDLIIHFNCRPFYRVKNEKMIIVKL
jgi:hypothetical protein